MSQGGLELVQQACESWTRGTPMLEILDPSIEWDTTRFEAWPEKRVYRGRQEVIAFLEEWAASWDSYEAGVDEYFEAGDRVVAFWWQRTVGRGSGVPVELQSAQVWTVKGGRVLRIDNYTDRAVALEAVGLTGA